MTEKRPGSEDLATFIASSSALLRGAGVNVNRLKSRFKAGELRDTLDLLCSELSEKGVKLPPGYWSALQRASEQIAGADYFESRFGERISTRRNGDDV